MNSSLPVCSVLIVVKDEPSIAETLTALKPECEALGAECIVVDSSEGRLDAIAQAHGWVRWISYQQPLVCKSTISQQRNLAVASAGSDLLIFCDAGNFPEDGWLQAMYSALKSGNFQAIGGPIKFFNQKKRTLFTRNFGKYGELIEYPTCGNMGFSRLAFNLTDGFDENLLVAEDDDFIWALRKHGISCICIPGAVMHMDLGDRKRQRKRSWRYGKGIVNLLLKNPDLAITRFRKNPNVLLYPILIILYPTIIFLSLSNYVLLLIPFAVSMILIMRNGVSKLSLFNHLDHFVYSTGTIFELFRLLASKFRLPPILQYPNDNSTYIRLLTTSMNQSRKITSFFPEMTPSASLNLFLYPAISLLCKVRGVRLITIHWLVGKWDLHWAKYKWQRKLLCIWFKLWIYSLIALRIRVVYTVHDIIWHKEIFEDDQEAVKWLMKKVDGVVYLNPHSEMSVEPNANRSPSRVIPEGPIESKSDISRAEMRERLGVPEHNVLLVLLGYLQDYKGVDLLISDAHQAPQNISIRIAGVCHPAYRAKLEELLKRRDLIKVDIEFQEGFLSDADYAGYLEAADYFIYPCRNINNSGSLNSALSAGVPVIVPDTEELDWIAPNCKIILQKSALGDFDFKKLFLDLLLVNQDQYTNLVSAARGWAEKRSWKFNASTYESLYKEILNG
jgi:glycosyltransferase involved in cell wall biosynthesis